jgi:hypothetical protein
MPAAGNNKPNKTFATTNSFEVAAAMDTLLTSLIFLQSLSLETKTADEDYGKREEDAETLIQPAKQWAFMYRDTLFYSSINSL